VESMTLMKARALLLTLQSVDFVLPTSGGRRLRRITEPTAEQKLLPGDWESGCRSASDLNENVVQTQQ